MSDQPVIAIKRYWVETRRVFDGRGGVDVAGLWCVSEDLYAELNQTLHAQLRKAEAERDAALRDKGRAEAAYKAACRYIDLSPCDPDIHADQYDAWLELRKIQAALAGERAGEGT